MARKTLECCSLLSDIKLFNQKTNYNECEKNKHGLFSTTDTTTSAVYDRKGEGSSKASPLLLSSLRTQVISKQCWTKTHLTFSHLNSTRDRSVCVKCVPTQENTVALSKQAVGNDCFNRGCLTYAIPILPFCWITSIRNTGKDILIQPLHPSYSVVQKSVHICDVCCAADECCFTVNVCWVPKNRCDLQS